MKLASLVENDDWDNQGVGRYSGSGYDTVQEIRADLYPYLAHEIAKLNRRAKKLGTPPIELIKKREFYKEAKKQNHAGIKTKTKWYEVEVTGEAPHVPGYDFLATINHTGEGNIIRMVPGANESNVKQFYDAKPDYCDHCKKVRKRIDTFIVRDKKTGDLRQIGRNCLSDFLGGIDPKGILFWTSIKSKIDDIFERSSSYEGPHGGRVEYSVSPKEVLYLAAGLVNLFGYKKSGSEGSTAEDIRWLVFDNNQHPQVIKDKKALRARIDDNKEKNEEYMEKALHWFNNDLPNEEKENNNFYHTIDVLLKNDNITYKNVGYIAAIFPAYDRAMGTKKEIAKKSNEWVGNPGDKISNINVTVTKTSFMPNRWAYNAPDIQLVKMEDDDGNSFTWFNGGKNHLEEEVSYIISGKIKKHDDYKGRKTTVLTHVKADKI